MLCSSSQPGSLIPGLRGCCLRLFVSRPVAAALRRNTEAASALSTSLSSLNATSLMKGLSLDPSCRLTAFIFSHQYNGKVASSFQTIAANIKYVDNKSQGKCKEEMKSCVFDWSWVVPDSTVTGILHTVTLSSLVTADQCALSKYIKRSSSYLDKALS